MFAKLKKVTETSNPLDSSNAWYIFYIYWSILNILHTTIDYYKDKIPFTFLSSAEILDSEEFCTSSAIEVIASTTKPNEIMHNLFIFNDRLTIKPKEIYRCFR